MKKIESQLVLLLDAFPEVKNEKAGREDPMKNEWRNKFCVPPNFAATFRKTIETAFNQMFGGRKQNRTSIKIVFWWGGDCEENIFKTEIVNFWAIDLHFQCLIKTDRNGLLLGFTGQESLISRTEISNR